MFDYVSDYAAYIGYWLCFGFIVIGFFWLPFSLLDYIIYYFSRVGINLGLLRVGLVYERRSCHYFDSILCLGLTLRTNTCFSFVGTNDLLFILFAYF